jgi:hypothetical protein
MTWLGAAGLALSGCAYGAPFDRFEGAEGAAVEAAPYPTLLEATETARALGPRPDAAVGAQVVAELDVEAAVSTARAQALSSPDVDGAALRDEAQAVRAAAR